MARHLIHFVKWGEIILSLFIYVGVGAYARIYEWWDVKSKQCNFMKHLSIWMLLLALSATLAVSADPLPGFRYEDATKFQIINKGWDNTTEPYTRLPQQYMDSCREEQQWLYNHSSGIAVRFATNSKRIAAQYNLKNNFHMQHMAMTGIKGTDLYFLN